MQTPGPHVRNEATKEPVMIWSNEHQAWWRENFWGYCTDPDRAGRYLLADAIAATHSCGPEKGIVIKDAISGPATCAMLREAVINAARIVVRSPRGWRQLRDALDALDAAEGRR